MSNLVCPSSVVTLKIDRREKLLSELFGYGRNTTAGVNGTLTTITSLTDGSLEQALTDDVPRLICFSEGLSGTWVVPSGVFTPAANKYVDGSNADITWQMGVPDNYISLNEPTHAGPRIYSQIAFTEGQFGMSDITIRGDMAWPFTYEAPYFSNGDTDIEIFSGENYFFNHVTLTRMSDESLSVYHLGGVPDNITFGNLKFIETKTASLVGALNASVNGHITIAYNQYNEAVNGRSPGDFRYMNAHIYNNYVGYMNDEGLRVSEGANVVSEYNVFDMGCNVGVSGPRVIRYVLPEYNPPGVLWSSGDIVDDVAKNCPFTLDEGFIESPAAMPFTPDYPYELLTERSEVESFTAANSGVRSEIINYTDSDQKSFS